MTGIDAHVHLWDPGLHDHGWLRSAGELNRPRLLDDLGAAAGPVTAVAVQAGRTVDEARWLLGLAACSPGSPASSFTRISPTRPRWT